MVKDDPFGKEDPKNKNDTGRGPGGQGGFHIKYNLYVKQPQFMPRSSSKS